MCSQPMAIFGLGVAATAGVEAGEEEEEAEVVMMGRSLNVCGGARCKKIDRAEMAWAGAPACSQVARGDGAKTPIMRVASKPL